MGACIYCDIVLGLSECGSETLGQGFFVLFVRTYCGWRPLNTQMMNILVFFDILVISNTENRDTCMNGKMSKLMDTGRVKWLENTF